MKNHGLEAHATSLGPATSWATHPFPVAEAGSCGIVEDVLNGMGQVSFVADQVVVVLRLPERSGAFQCLVGLVCGKGLP